MRGIPERRFRTLWAGASELPYSCDPVAQAVVRGGPLTLENVGLCFGVTRERLRQIETDAMIAFLQGLEDEGLSEGEIADLLSWLESRAKD